MAPTGTYIATPADLKPFCDSLRGATVLALDTEFVGEHSYYAKLEIVQVAADGVAGVIDFPAVGGLEPLLERLYDPAVEKVFHAGTQDLEILYRLGGRPLAPVFDTQVAAAFVGLGASIGYSALVERVTGRRLKKLHTVTDWSRRPLSPSQLSYAVDDVTFLLPIHAHLHERLQKLGRLGWVREECKALEGVPVKEQVEDRERYRRVKEWNKLDRRGLAILRELAAWREAAARARNAPRPRVLADEILVEIARLGPARAAELRTLRRLYPRVIERDGESIIAAVRRGQAVPDKDLPAMERGPRRRVRAGTVDLLNAFLRARSEEEDIAPSLLATVGELETLAHDPRGEDARALPILHGWRREMVGNEILDILEGRASIRVDAGSGKVILERMR